MTGYAQHRQTFAENELAPQCPPITVVVEAQSINNRYLEILWRSDEALKFLENGARIRIKNFFERGRININIAVQLTHSLIGETADFSSGNHPDSPKAQTALALLELWQQAIIARSPQSKPLSVYEILRLLGVSTPIQAPEKIGSGWASLENLLDLSESAREIFQKAAETQLLSVIESCLQSLCQCREEEAKRILPLLREKAQMLSQQHLQIKTWTQSSTQTLAERMKTQLATLLRQAPEEARVDEQRIAQEIALLAIRHDITEEWDRLLSHLTSLNDLLRGSATTVGKPLEFLLQELGREVNTIASKTTQTEISQITLSMKQTLDQIREQAQNIQ